MPWRHRFLPGLVACVGILAFQAFLLHPLHRSMDLPTWDESNQMGWGAEFAAGSPIQSTSHCVVFPSRQVALSDAVGVLDVS